MISAKDAELSYETDMANPTLKHTETEKVDYIENLLPVLTSDEAQHSLCPLLII